MAYLSPFVTAIWDERGEMDAIFTSIGKTKAQVLHDIVDNNKFEYVRILFEFWADGHPKKEYFLELLGEDDSKNWLNNAFNAMLYSGRDFWSGYGDD
jgi:hypothetical protein